MSSFMGRDARPAPDSTKPLTVTALNQQARALLEQRFPDVWVEGEISRPTQASSGHLYFGLKDQGARIDGVLWAQQARLLTFPVQEGQRVVARGRLTVFAPMGRYQLVCESLQPAGEGALRAALLELKKKLESEGLLDAERKRPLPFLPRGVGLVTSRTGAAVQDICRMIYKRFPTMRVVLCPVRVQGQGAAQEVAQGIERIGRVEGLDVVVVGRGGGSLEDLWTFNEEIVARAIAASRLPVVSAVGHEIDVTLSDLVADLRVPTPTAAGEAVVPDLADVRDVLDDAWTRLVGAIRRRGRESRSRLADLGRRAAFRRFRSRVLDMRQLLDFHGERMVRGMRRLIERDRRRLAESGALLRARTPRHWARARRVDVQVLGRRLVRVAERRVTGAREVLGPLKASLEALNPTAVLRRGFTVTRVERDGDLSIVRSGDEVAAGEAVRTTFAEGPDLVARAEARAERDLPEAPAAEG